MTPLPSPPPYRIRAPRTWLRCYEPSDASLLEDAVDTSLGHLRPWMPWVRLDPQPLDEKVQLLRGSRAAFDLDRDYVYGVFDEGETELLGGTRLHSRVGPRALEVGYWVRASAVRRGLATEMAGALTRVGFEWLGLDRIEIHCDARNAPSAAIPARLGYALEATLRRRRLPGDDEPRDFQVWTLFADGYPGTPAASIELEAHDAAGRPLAP